MSCEEKEDALYFGKLVSNDELAKAAENSKHDFLAADFRPLISPTYFLRVDDSLNDAEKAMWSLDLKLRDTVSESLAGFAINTNKDKPSRLVRDAEHSETTEGKIVRTEDGKPSSDSAVNDAYDNAGNVWKFYKEVLNRVSIDNNNHLLDSTVHYGVAVGNAFWNKAQMFYGDGDSQLKGLTKALDVVAHEMTHGLVQYTTGFVYSFQPGALNESVADCFGIAVRHKVAADGGKPESGDHKWKLGFLFSNPKHALRSFSDPGKAFPQDQQVQHMDKFLVLPNTRSGDWGGVHLNSGIPNKAFYLVCTKLKAESYGRPIHIWFDALTKMGNKPNCQFVDWAKATYAAAQDSEKTAVKEAWQEVGVNF